MMTCGALSCYEHHSENADWVSKHDAVISSQVMSAVVSRQLSHNAESHRCTCHPELAPLPDFLFIVPSTAFVAMCVQVCSRDL